MITLYGCVAMLAISNPGADPQSSGASPAQTPKPKVKSGQKPTSSPKTKNSKASATALDQLMDRVEAYYRGLEDYKADFVQTYTKVALSRTTESKGTLMIKKPGLMRWSYREPIEKLWVVDGDTLYVADPEFEQVFVDKNFKTADLEKSIRFLWGRGRLADSFKASLGEPATYKVSPSLGVLELVPKEGATYAKLVLVVEPATGQVQESILYETAGNTNRFAFKNAKINPGLDRKQFQYVPPAGWEIIRR